MFRVFDNKNNCCGCTACASICPVEAINMKYDECGFSYPQIDTSVCIDCGLCRKVCDFSKPNEYSLFRECYVAKHRSEQVVSDSRSGGFFTSISDIILSEGGVVYGALLDSDFFVRHVRAINTEERNALRKSKYVQSDLTGIFSQVRQDLMADRKVLFTGTGCQCGGLLSFLKAESTTTENLLVCDIVCHSNASPQLFRKYLNYQKNRFNSPIAEYYFRDKSKYSWRRHVEKIVFESGKIFYTDEYTNFFYSDDIRLSCFQCKYASLHRCGDITIADCWGGEKKYPDLVNDEGASLVILNTDKGMQYLDKIEDMDIRKISIEDVMQPRLEGPESKSTTYNSFWEDYINLQFSQFMKKYGQNNYAKYKVFLSKIEDTVLFPYRAMRNFVRGYKNG